MRRWRERNPDKLAVYAERHRASQRELVKKYQRDHPERLAAHRAVFIRVRNGSLKPQPCWCGNEKTEAHHPDYSKPLEIVWLCKQHHEDAHHKQAS